AIARATWIVLPPVHGATGREAACPPARREGVRSFGSLRMTLASLDLREIRLPAHRFADLRIKGNFRRSGRIERTVREGGRNLSAVGRSFSVLLGLIGFPHLSLDHAPVLLQGRLGVFGEVRSIPTEIKCDF